MKKCIVLSIFIIFFISGVQESDTEKSGSAAIYELIKENNNDQGEDEGNGKNRQR